MNDDFRWEEDDPLEPTFQEEELESLLQRWRIDQPSPDLGVRVLRSYRSKRSLFAGLARGTIRVPLWAAAVILILFLALVPLAVRGLTSNTPRPETDFSRKVRFVEVRGATQLGSMETKGAASADSYITVTDLTELRPAENINLKVFRSEEKKQ